MLLLLISRMLLPFLKHRTVSLTWLHKTTRFTLPTFSSSSTPTTHPTQLQPAFALQDPSPSTSTAEAAASPSSLLEQLWDGILRAVPKSKVSHSRKAMRSANKGLKDRTGEFLPKTEHHPRRNENGRRNGLADDKIIFVFARPGPLRIVWTSQAGSSHLRDVLRRSDPSAKGSRKGTGQATAAGPAAVETALEDT